jgi:hypothetical protein
VIDDNTKGGGPPGRVASSRGLGVDRRWRASAASQIQANGGVGASVHAAETRSCGGVRAVHGVRAEEARSMQIWRCDAAVEGERGGLRTVWGGGGERHLGSQSCAVFRRIGSSVGCSWADVKS